ncbi:hypothetical protein SCLCIDRAFT_1164341 [Scleroderma citrinum Foug A]|uniref:Heterokaryon incompatibility domain-containing protein n=1 Tax=Scleroderma citrinum Foug A TaxID=1036808 RepID=A0A0C3CUS9_9AGAM|nr:hypothetical protein SCLCIDRAFT_1164341 [Scleroderma citrinum Foug A]
MDPETGECTKLLVQAVKPAPKTNQVKVTDSIRKIPKLSVSLFRSPPQSVAEALLWPLKFLLCSICLLFWPLDAFPGRESFTGEYPTYLMNYWGQMWAARSQREYSRFEKLREKNPMPTPAGFTATVPSVTRALRPRKLVIYRDNTWQHCEDPSIIINYRFIAISYRQRDMKKGKREEEQRNHFIESIRATTLQCGMQAYWLDLECLGKSTEETNIDVYRMADIYRGANFTLITIGKSDDEHSIQSWKSWGGRVWTFPEALLSRELRYRIGIDGPVLPITLHELANKAYEHHSEEAAIIHAYSSGKDPLERLERLTLLKSAIWRRGSAALPPVAPPKDVEKSMLSSQSQPTAMESPSYPAERVYALMGFYEHRIMPSRLETELQALARLSMANDSDRMAERMVSMLPYDIQPQACWYADNDLYGSQLWDIEPEIQVAGVTENGALVLDGCRAATIRWEDFPEVSFQTTESFRRDLAGKIPISLPGIVLYAATWMPVPSVISVGTAFFGCAAFLLVFSPFLTAYSISGRILNTQPWLIGVKGVLSPEKAAERIYGATLSHHSRLSYSPSGSLFSRPSEDEIREGLQSQYEEVKDLQRDDVYTLIDTCSTTIYYFTAERPPTVCLFTGREGGLGRFVLCSENCTANELHKETVLRMPSYIQRAMNPCDWVAIG